MHKDDVEGIRRKILAADMLVFVTPLYYYGMSAQLKIMIDRFCAFNSSIQRKHMNRLTWQGRSAPAGSQDERRNRGL